MKDERAEAANVVIMHMGYGNVGNGIYEAGAFQVSISAAPGIDEESRTRAGIDERGGAAIVRVECTPNAKKPDRHVHARLKDGSKKKIRRSPASMASARKLNPK